MNKGFTLIEILISASIALVLGLAAVSLFSLVHAMTVSTTSSYLISRDLNTGLHRLRSDLRNTALASIRTFPPPDHRQSYSGPPGVTMVSPFTPNGRFSLDPTGAPRWPSVTAYVLDYSPGSATGNLVRWQKTNTSLLPTADTLPFPIPSSTISKEVIFRNVVAPDSTLSGVGEKGQIRSDKDGGFRLRFVRLTGDPTNSRAYTLSKWNPAQVTQGQAEGLDFVGNTLMVSVRLQLYERDNSDKSNYISIEFKVTPKY